jgi:hypothetical protein
MTGIAVTGALLIHQFFGGKKIQDSRLQLKTKPQSLKIFGETDVLNEKQL